MSRKPKANEEDESLDFIVGIGTYQTFTSVPKDDKPKKARKQIGFIRETKKRVRRNASK